FIAQGSKGTTNDFDIQGPYMLYVSRFEHYKRHLELVKAYDSLSQEIKDAYSLVFIGGHALPRGEEVKAFIREKGLENRVKLYGEIPYRELPKIYQKASMFIFPSVCENCPNILLEAM